MLRWLIFSLALSLGALGLLNVCLAPPWSPWKLGVLAGEFGHWLALGALALAGAAWALRGGGAAVAGVSVALALAAAVLLARPTWAAVLLARELPARFTAELGAGAAGGAGTHEGGNGGDAFAVRGLCGGREPEVRVETFDVSAGLPLDFYRAERTDGKPAPVVIVVHGGGWDSGDRTQLPELNHWLARRGYAVAAISYRLAPRHVWPAPRDDVLAALATLKARSAALGIDPRRIVLLGRSAGGQIAQVVAYTARDPAIRGLVALYAPSDLYFGYVNTHEDDMLRSPALMRQYLGGPPEQVRAQYESASALNFVTPTVPPTLLLHGRNDALAWYRHSERLAARLREEKVPHVHVELPWATHAFDFNLRGPGGQITTWAVERFLAAVTGEARQE
jgi:acetyl esterase/lipase